MLEKKLVKYIEFVFSLLLVSFSTMSFAVEKDIMSNPNKPILTSPSAPEVTLKLESNPTTGYSWFLVSYDHQLLSPVSHHYVPVHNGLVGVPGYELWRFKVNPQAFSVPQVTEITLHYARSWEMQAIHKFKFLVIINPRYR